MNKIKSIVSFSGGLDSSVLLSYLISMGITPIAVSFNYGSKHNEREISSAKKQCEKLKIEHIIIDLNFIESFFISDLLKTGGDIPEGHYEADNMKSTVVPFRNGIMLSILAGLAESKGCNTISLASHSGDHHIYPDCRPEFNRAIKEAIKFGTEKGIKVTTPFENMTKGHIVEIGKNSGVDFNLTYSCYKGKEKHCGKCGTCIERKEAFKNAMVEDPTIYEGE